MPSNLAPQINQYDDVENKRRRCGSAGCVEALLPIDIRIDV